MKEKAAKRLYRALAVFLGILVFVAALLLSVMIADAICERSAHVTPSYKKEDITEIADKAEWTDEDILFLYRQTGLGKTALLQMKSNLLYLNEEPVPLSERLKEFQEALFYEGETEHELVADVSKRDLMKGFSAPVAPVLEAGDILVNSSTHTLGFRNGHAAIVLDEYGTVLESLELGRNSGASNNGHLWFAESSNFMLLRLKDVDKDTRANIAKEARKELTGIPYSIAVGVFSKKDQGIRPKSTHCSHLVWQAYKNAGYEIDSNGGIVVTPQDIARSPLFEVVQVYGFDPEKLW
ncbi:MAG: hypothetical protein K2L02_02655 [Clostridia bacterium]|nr:hypothetical protein [Clostridia bacterium]